MEVASSQCPGHVLAFNHATQEWPCFRRFFDPLLRKYFWASSKSHIFPTVRTFSWCDSGTVIDGGRGGWERRTAEMHNLSSWSELGHNYYWNFARNEASATWCFGNCEKWGHFSTSSCHYCLCRFDNSLHAVHTGCVCKAERSPRTHWSLCRFLHPLCLPAKSIQSTCLGQVQWWILCKAQNK